MTAAPLLHPDRVCETADCDNTATHIVCGFNLCPHCLLESEFKMLHAIFYNEHQSPDLPPDLYELQESIHSACGRRPNEGDWLAKAAHDIKTFIRQNALCTDPLPRLKQLKDDLWELAP